jgi:regulatory protein
LLQLRLFLILLEPKGMAGTITALELQEHNRERVNVYLDGTFAFGLAAIEAARFRKGQYLTDSEIAALKAHDAVEQAYERAVKYLGQRPRSTGEIRRYLGQKKADPAVIDEVMTRLESQGYVDDLAFARYWIANRQQFRPRGSRALRFELREKGLPPALIDEVLAGFDAADAAYQAALDKARRFRGLDRRAFREKLGSFLTRRGFDYGTARDVIDRLIREFEEADAGAFVPSPNELDDTEE